jgi:ABC-type sugar transport system ATPase subunit
MVSRETDPAAVVERVARMRAAGLSKSYGSACVLAGADLEVGAGEIHALVGANGSGKSTLIKCITGVERPDRGSTIEIDGHDVSSGYSTSTAHELGVRVVHQEAPLIDELTLAETVGLHRGFPTRGGVIRTRRLNARTAELFERLRVELSPRTRAGSLSPPERAMVMLALALGSGDGKLIVLDEPTASLTSGDAERFLESVVQATASGAGVLLVTHRLGEVFGICGRVTVLREGRVVLQTATAQTSREQVVNEIIGPTVDRTSVHAARVPERFRPAAADRDDGDGTAEAELSRQPAGSPAAALEATEISGDVVDGISLAVRPGEILGISGLLGSGAAELCALLAGAKRLRAGAIAVGRRTLSGDFGTRRAVEAGIAYVPGDRLREGGIARLSLLENMALPNLGHYALSRRMRLDDFRQVVDALDVRPPEPERAFGTLSGGNQQKVIVGKWALLRPTVFLLDNPTAGVDPGAREQILALLKGLAQAGTALIAHSSEPEELARLASRVLVVREGRIAVELAGDEVTERAITAAN